MTSVKVFGSGCKACKNLYENVIKALSEKGISVKVEYVTEFQDIVGAGIMILPALAIDGKVVSAGKTLSVTEVKAFF